MSNIPQTFIGVIKGKYKKSGYLDKYGGDTIITGFVLTIFWLIFSYYFIRGKMKPIKADWINQRCNPAVIPFAGMINAPPGVSKFTFTGSNFSNCMSQILKHILGEVTKPISFAIHSIMNVTKEAEGAMGEIRKVFATLRTHITQIVKPIINRALNFLVPILVMVVKMKDVLLKTGGILTTVLLTTLGIYDTLKSFIGAFLELLIIALIILVAAIIILWIMPWTWPIALIGTAIFVFLAVLCAIMVHWFEKILNLTQTQNTPTSSCFDGDTAIATKAGCKPIKELRPGEILADGSCVTAVFKMSSKGEKIYNYDNIIVSGSHPFMTGSGKCLRVSDHPKSQRLRIYNKPYLYCLSTSTKTIKIGEHLFSDWDEIDHVDWEKIKYRAHAYLPEHPQKSDFHQYLESGLGGDTLIELWNGESVPLKNVKVGDYLKNGVKVLGIVSIDGNHLLVKKYNIKGNEITCAPNVLFSDNNLGNLTTLKMRGEPIYNEHILYHLITDKKFFHVSGVDMYDYNGMIEEMMETPDILFPSF